MAQPTMRSDVKQNNLSPRERSILELVGDGCSDKEIARDLGIAPGTVKSHLKHIFTKLNVNNRVRAVSVAYVLGIVGPRAAVRAALAPQSRRGSECPP